MKVTIDKSAIKGAVSVPASKSMTIRALMCAALSVGQSNITNPLISDDTDAAATVLTKAGTVIIKGKDEWKVIGGKFRINQDDLHCGESATTLRFMTAICSLIPGQHRLLGGPSLMQRPIASLVEALEKLGVRIFMERLGFPPVFITGGTLKGGLTDIPGNISSQYISALLLVSPFSLKGVNIRLTTPLTSKPYILMTLWCLKKFGINVQPEGNQFVIARQRYHPANIEIESDWSSASYFLALGAISEEGVKVRNLNQGSLQGDRVILDILRAMGANVKISGSDVFVSHGQLKRIQTDLSDCIDLLPTVAALAALAKGVSIFSGIQRARLKESDRIAAVKEGLLKLGVTVVESEDRLKITGKDIFKKPAVAGSEEAEEEEEADEKSGAGESKGPAVLNSCNDHRIAMAFSILGAALGNVVISGAECVTKTFPAFWDVFKKVGGEVKIDGQ